MKPRVIGFLITLKCNVRCKHCCFHSGPDRSDSMSRAQALNYVRQVAMVGYLRGISITGGEPFLDYSLLRDVIYEVGKHRLSARVVSNCFWAVSPARATAKLTPLVENGLKELSVSYDAAHEEFVRRERVTYAIEAALALGLKVVVSTVHPNGEMAQHIERITAELGLPQHPRLYIMPGYIVPSGRAVEHFDLSNLALVDGDTSDGARLKHPCPHVIREPIITPSGDLAACCSPSTAIRTGFNKHYVIGNLKERQLSELLNELEQSLVFNAIMVEGPWALRQMVEDVDSSAIKRKSFINICDLCQQVMGSERAREILRDRLPERELTIWLKKLALNAYADGDLDDHLVKELNLVQMRPFK